MSVSNGNCHKRGPEALARGLLLDLTEPLVIQACIPVSVKDAVNLLTIDLHLKYLHIADTKILFVNRLLIVKCKATPFYV